MKIGGGGGIVAVSLLLNMADKTSFNGVPRPREERWYISRQSRNVSSQSLCSGCSSVGYSPMSDLQDEIFDMDNESILSFC